MVFPSLLPSYKWTATSRNLENGDVVLIYHEGLKRGTFQLGKILDATKSDDGLVRKATVHYMVGGTKKTVEKAVSSLVLIVPNDYKNEEL